MFIQNQIISLPNHLKKIKGMLNGADKAFLTVAYIRNSGVDQIIDDLQSIIDKHGKVKLICSNDMGITQPTAIKRVLDIGAEVKICKFDAGTFHAKIWLTEKDGMWSCLVGSANCSKSAFLDNVEASLIVEQNSNFGGSIEQALMFFEYLWNNDKCFDVTDEILGAWQERKNNIAKTKQEISEVKLTTEKQKVIDILFGYVKDWLDIAKDEKQKDEYKESLWRGWYVIPDQDLITDDTMVRLQKILKVIEQNKTLGVFDISKNSLVLPKVFEITKNKFKRETLTMLPRELFIRQEKNYLVRFGFVRHPIKKNNKEDENKLIITELGEKLAACESITCLKRVYSNNMIFYRWGNAYIFAFALKLLQKFQYITLDEFSLFVMHTYSDDEFEDIKNLIAMYRGLSRQEQKYLCEKINKYFDVTKGITAKNVRGNYFKHAKYTLMAIGWLDGLWFDEENKKVELIDESEARILLENSDILN